jgi:MYXO-CTERM domain-containing protein
MRNPAIVSLVSMLVLASTSATAIPILDGVKDGSYGAAVSVQTVETQFGNANPNGGSELDAAYAQIDGGVLYLMLTGNLESNFNSLNIFIDSVAGGQNQLQADANSGGNNPENNGWADKHVGMTFDNGFEADYLISLRNGVFGTDRFDIDYSIVSGGLGAYEAATNIFGGSLTGSNGAALPNGIGVGFNNSNVGGVSGGTGAANQAAALAVTTGVELAIPFSALGNPNPQNILISAMINGSNHDYLSNQFLGGLLPPQGNLGGDGNGGFTGTVSQIDLNEFAGNQFFAVAETAAPEPSTALLAASGLVGLLARRRRFLTRSSRR